jgi:DNA invertase Pin-like site-specific DNA recombinase
VLRWDLALMECAAAVERHACPMCEVPAGSPCRTRAGRVAAKYHTARFVLVPALREELAVTVPAHRGGQADPGARWAAGPPVPIADPEASTAAPIRIGYARCSTAQQDLDIQITALRAAGCQRVFSEKISSRVRVRPEYDNALALARDIKHAAPDQPVLFCVHELKRPARNAAELMALAAQLQAHGVQLELLTGPLTGVYDPNGLGAMLFAVLAVAAQLDRNYIREKTLEGQQAAAAKGRHGGRPKVIDDDMLIFARALHAAGTPVPQIVDKLVISTGKNTGKHPSVASVYRALADDPDIDFADTDSASHDEPTGNAEDVVTHSSRAVAPVLPAGSRPTSWRPRR